MRISLFFFVLCVHLLVRLSAGDNPITCPSDSPLCDPAHKLDETAPEQFSVDFDTTAGGFTVKVVRAWCPIGADRFYNLVKNRFYDYTRFFRVLPTFMVQFGVNGQPSVSANYLTPAGQIDNDLAANVTLQSNTRGYITYGAEYNSDNMAVNRTTEIFINYVNNSRLDANGFIPFGFVDEQGMKAVDQIYSGYGEMADICEGAAHTGNGNVSSSCIYPYGPWSSLLYSEGNAYLNANYSKMDYVRSARVRKETTGIDWRVLLGLSIVLVALVVTICWMLYLNKKNEQMFRNDINGDETTQDETGNRVPQYDPLAEDDDTGSPFLSTNFEEL